MAEHVFQRSHTQTGSNLFHIHQCKPCNIQVKQLALTEISIQLIQMVNFIKETVEGIGNDFYDKKWFLQQQKDF